MACGFYGALIGETVYQINLLNEAGYAVRGKALALSDRKMVFLFKNGILKVTPNQGITPDLTFIKSPCDITAGTAYLSGKLYFGSGPYLWSCAINTPANNEKGDLQ